MLITTPKIEETIMKNLTLTSTAVLLMALASTSPAKIFKWVDASGQLHYTERPAPAGKKAEDIEDEIRIAAILKRKGKRDNRFSYLQDNKKKMSEKSEEKEQNVGLRDEIANKQKVAEDNYREQLNSYCNSQRANLKQLQSGNPITWEENGETKLLTSDQKKTKISSITKSVKKNCSNKKTVSEEE